MATIVVLYPMPEDRDGFEAYYREQHMPIARDVPGATWTVTRFSSDLRGGDASFAILAVASFADADARQAGLTSEQMRAAGQDARAMAERFGIRPVMLLGEDL